MPRPQDWMKPTPHVRIDAGGEEATWSPASRCSRRSIATRPRGELAELAARRRRTWEVKRVETQTLRMETRPPSLHARQLALAAPPHQGGGEANAMVAVFQGMVAAADRRADALEAEMNRMRDTAAQEQARYNREQIEELKAERNRAVAVDPLTSFFTLLEKLPQARQAMDAVSPTASPVPSGVTDPHVLIETLRIQREGSLQQQKMNIDLQEFPAPPPPRGAEAGRRTGPHRWPARPAGQGDRDGGDVPGRQGRPGDDGRRAGSASPDWPPRTLPTTG